MSHRKSFFDETQSVSEWALSRDPPRSPAWAYQQIARGLPVFTTGESKGYRVHPPTADDWYRSRMKSRRKPAKVDRRASREAVNQS